MLYAQSSYSKWFSYHSQSYWLAILFFYEEENCLGFYLVVSAGEDQPLAIPLNKSNLVSGFLLHLGSALCQLRREYK